MDSSLYLLALTIWCLYVNTLFSFVLDGTLFISYLSRLFLGVSLYDKGEDTNIS